MKCDVLLIEIINFLNSAIPVVLFIPNIHEVFASFQCTSSTDQSPAGHRVISKLFAENTCFTKSCASNSRLWGTNTDHLSV